MYSRALYTPRRALRTAFVAAATITTFLFPVAVIFSWIG